MDNTECNSKEDGVVELNIISKIILDLEKKVSLKEIKPKECEELKILKEKCCDKNATVSLTAFHGITYLLNKQILIESQTISMLVSLLPSIKEFGGLVTTIGNILISDFQKQIMENGKYECSHLIQYQHPFFIVLKCNWEKSWFEVYNFILGLFRMNEDMIWKHKIEFIQPLFHQIFWSSTFQGSELQLKLFSALMTEFHEKGVINFALETFLWQELNIHFCFFIQEFFIHLLEGHEKSEVIAFGLSPLLAIVIKWLILNGCNPGSWLKILSTCIDKKMASGSPVLYILSDVVRITPSAYINQLINVCESIILSTYCNKYVAYKFMAVILNWFVSPSFLVNPVYKSLERIIDFMTGGVIEWNGLTCRLNENEYYKTYGSSKKEVKFAVDVIETCNRLEEGKMSVKEWLKNLRDSNDLRMLSKLNAFIQGILLCEKDQPVVNLCLEILFKVINHQKGISFSVLCLLFYKLGKEEDPKMQKIYLFSLPKLSVEKENIPLIVGIIESLKRGPPKLMIPLVIQLYLSLWKFDSRTYSYLHKALHEKTSGDFDWELNISKALALKEICQLAPHLHAKDLVGVLSKILNEPYGTCSGLPSAIAIEAVVELCKAYVIDVSGTWSAIQPKLRVERRPEIVVSLCRFFGEIPNLNCSEQEKEELTKNIIPMLWEYTFFSSQEVVRSAFRALSNYPLENFPLKLFPEKYRVDVKLPKDVEKKSRAPEDILLFPVSSAGCWIQFLQKINDKILRDGGELVQAVVERELTSLPRGIFHLPPEKTEPLSYSYLPSRSVCRGLVECLQKHTRENSPDTPRYLQEIIRVLGHTYSKFLPPLNWSFLGYYMSKGWELLQGCLALLVKQAPVSPSAWSILENYFKSVEWNTDKFEEILFFYNVMPLLTNSVSYGVLHNFLERTIKISLETTLNEKGTHFEKIIQNLTEALKSKAVQPVHKNLIAKQMEKIFHLIPSEHKIMKMYATCALEFPVKLVEEITSVKGIENIGSEGLQRVVIIRSAIAMREDIQNPLVWLSELTEAVAHYPEEQNFVLNAIWLIIRKRRECDHRPWVTELIWKTQTYIRASESVKATLFFVDVFVTVIIILSGYDCLFLNFDDFKSSDSKKLQIFPQALCDLLSTPDWSDMLQKVGLWLQKLSKWKHLSEDQENMIIQTLLLLKEVKSFGKENECSLFNFSLQLLKSNR